MPPDPPTPITCVMPSYNEELLIAEAVHGLLGFWRGKPNPFLLIVVDDGSTDRTREILTGLADENDDLRVISYMPNRGKGWAVRTGMAEVPDAGIVYFVDSDLPYSLEDQFAVVSAVTADTPAAYGSRIVDKGFQGASLLRRLASRVLIILNRVILGIRVKDNQCGLKAFRAPIAKKVFARNTVDRFGFDLFTTAYLTKHGVGISTVPVRLLPERRPSTVGVLRVSLRMLRDIFSVRRAVRRLPRDETLTT